MGLIGVFASQLATETWKTVQSEVEAEKKKDDGLTDDVIRDVMGVDLPQWIIGIQLTFQQAVHNLNQLIRVEYDAQVWNYTKDSPLPKELDPACCASSPEIRNKYQGLDLGMALCDG